MSAAPAVTYRVSAPAPDMLFSARGVQWHGKWDQRMGLHSDLSTGGKWGDWGIISNYFILCHYGGFYVGGNVNNGDIMWPQIHNIILHHHLLCWSWTAWHLPPLQQFRFPIWAEFSALAAERRLRCGQGRETFQCQLSLYPLHSSAGANTGPIAPPWHYHSFSPNAKCHLINHYYSMIFYTIIYGLRSPITCMK